LLTISWKKPSRKPMAGEALRRTLRGTAPGATGEKAVAPAKRITSAMLF
jgi:hypothetical protein